ncbi:MAG: aminotransferase class IV [Comamonadaceae bacterium]|nr:aminotransferase class IV [Comamonadaceae bacterium]
MADVPLVVLEPVRAGRHLRPRLGRPAPVDQVSCRASTRSRRTAMATALPDTLVLPERRVHAAVARPRSRVLDRGFIFGDGVYEVVPVYGRRLFRFDEHMARLERSLAQDAHRATRTTRDEWLERCRRLVAALAETTGAERPAGLHPGHARRGAARPRDARRASTPTVFMMANPMKPADRRAAPPRRGLRHRARLPLGARRHQEHQPARQRAGAADLGRPRRRRDHHVPRRLPHRGRGEQRLGRARGRAARPAQERARARRHPRRAAARAVRGVRHRLQPAPDLRGRRAAPPTRCC